MRLAESYTTEFYISDAGYLVIKQECMECGKESTFMLTQEQTRILYRKFPVMLEEQDVLWTGIAKE